jgi:hypothetical protein
MSPPTVERAPRAPDFIAEILRQRRAHPELLMEVQERTVLALVQRELDMVDVNQERTVRFGLFEVDLRAGELRKNESRSSRSRF